MSTRTLTFMLAAFTVAFLVGVSGCATTLSSDDRQQLCEFDQQSAVPFNMKRIKFDNALNAEVPPQTEILICSLRGNVDTVISSEIFRREKSRTLVIWVNDALHSLPAGPFFRYAVGRELLRYSDESGICDLQIFPEYIPCELLLDRAVAKRFSSQAETAATLRAIIAALDATGKQDILIRTVEHRLILFEKNSTGERENDDDADDDTALAQQ